MIKKASKYLKMCILLSKGHREAEEIFLTNYGIV